MNIVVAPSELNILEKHKAIEFIHDILSKPIQFVNGIYNVNDSYRFIFEVTSIRYRLLLQHNNNEIASDSNKTLNKMMSAIIHSILRNNICENLYFIRNHDFSPRIHASLYNIRRCVTDKIFRPIMLVVYPNYKAHKMIVHLTDKQKQDVIALYCKYSNNCNNPDDYDPFFDYDCCCKKCSTIPINDYTKLLPNLQRENVFHKLEKHRFIELCLPKRTKSAANIF